MRWLRPAQKNVHVEGERLALPSLDIPAHVVGDVEIADGQAATPPARGADDVIALEHDVLAPAVRPRHPHLVAEAIAGEARVLEVEESLRADELRVRDLDVPGSPERDREILVGGVRDPPLAELPLRVAGRLRRRPARPGHVLDADVAE